MTAARRLDTTRAQLNTPPPTRIPGQLLLDEAIPDGTFGGRHDASPPPRPPLRPWTAQEQYEHRRDLLAALEGWDWTDDYNDTRRTRERQRYHRNHPAA
ncbi:hypothetical protein [Streptomyces wedmorensis]